MIERIQANAAMVRKFASDACDADIGFDEAGVRWLDDYIKGPAQRLDEPVKEKMVSMFGSYLGECIRQTYGGRWVEQPEYGWGMEIAKDFMVFPFNKVDKQMDQIEGDSVYGLFSSIGPMLVMHRKTPDPAPSPAPSPAPKSATRPTPAPRPWWKFW